LAPKREIFVYIVHSENINATNHLSCKYRPHGSQPEGFSAEKAKQEEEPNRIIRNRFLLQARNGT
jgi:hypothetical protein